MLPPVLDQHLTASNTIETKKVAPIKTRNTHKLNPIHCEFQLFWVWEVFPKDCLQSFITAKIRQDSSGDNA
jgi:hypothetical protein